LPPKKKGQPNDKRRKTAERNNSVEEEGIGAGDNDSDSSSPLAHSDVDKDVNSGMILVIIDCMSLLFSQYAFLHHS
jgi:hypothetical protein